MRPSIDLLPHVSDPNEVLNKAFDFGIISGGASQLPSDVGVQNDPELDCRENLPLGMVELVELALSPHTLGVATSE